MKCLLKALALGTSLASPLLDYGAQAAQIFTLIRISARGVHAHAHIFMLHTHFSAVCTPPASRVSHSPRDGETGWEGAVRCLWAGSKWWSQNSCSGL